jgi:hypothetical protein
MLHALRSLQPHGRIDSQDDRKEEVLATIPQGCGDTVMEVVMIHNSTGTTAGEWTHYCKYTWRRGMLQMAA